MEMSQDNWLLCERRTILLTDETVGSEDLGSVVKPSFSIDIAPACGFAQHYRVHQPRYVQIGGTRFVNCVDVFEIVCLRSSEGDAQILLFGVNFDFQPFCLDIHLSNPSVQTYVPDTRIVVPQFGAGYALTVGYNREVMQLVEDMQSQPLQKWHMEDGSLQLHMLGEGKPSGFFRLSSGNHVKLRREPYYEQKYSVNVAAEFDSSKVYQPPRSAESRWRQVS